MKNVIIIGSGAVAAELTSYINDHNNYVQEDKKLKLLGYLDTEENIAKYWAKYKLKQPVLDDIYSYEIKDDDHFIIGISDIDFRNKMVTVLKNKKARITGFIHYSSVIAETVQLGIGNIIYPFCIVGPNCAIGDFNLITGYSFISHDCVIGNNNFFSTAGLGGRVTIGNSNFFGIRSTVIPNISIGSNNIVQAGMIVDKSVEDNCTVFHRFKEKVIAIPKN